MIEDLEGFFAGLRLIASWADAAVQVVDSHLVFVDCGAIRRTVVTQALTL